MGGWPAGGPPDSLLPAAVAGALAPTSARVVLLPRTTGPGVTALLPHILATLALLGLALLLGATAYESVVMAPNYERDIPDSILRARDFLVRTTPAHYFRPLSLANQLVLLAGVAATWSLPDARWSLAAALGVLVLLDAITFAWHYPRLAILFKAPPPHDPATLRRAAREWAGGNLVRLVLLVVGFLAAYRGALLLGPGRHG